MSEDNPNNQGPADMGDSIDFFRQLENMPLPNMASAVEDAGLDEERASMLWMAMLSSLIVNTSESDNEAQENLIRYKHSAMEFHHTAEEECPVCGTRHGMYVFSIYTKTPEELERIRAAVHREMAAIQADRGDRLTS